MHFPHVAAWPGLLLPPLLLLLTSASGQAGSNTTDLNLVRILETIDNKTVSCPATASQCRNATVAAPLLLESFKEFGVGCRQEAACLVGLMMLESVSFNFMRNQSPGRPGQGTANMQMCNFNLKWARELKPDSFADACSDLNCPEKECADAQTCNNVLDSVLETDRGNFFSAAWFYATQCKDDDVKNRLRDNVEGCSAYLKTCVGVDPKDKDRVVRNQKAFEAFGVANATKCVPL
ncbi:hypothetical protein XA68_13926 [Ophiocordyceps unilateralis]|uniref:Uncharacterized protein n=1 Tax=Ophiocordyceps unilateralis TaxID=268505 RepID=A0A2A9PA39_OPHUN|nr:hypothetical protein XA68_13926 [Ophiocordyceps unilateralis]